EFEPADFKAGNFDEACSTARERAGNMAPTFVIEAMDENLNPDEDPKEWKWQEMTRVVNAKYGLKLNERELKQVGRDGLSEYVLAKAEASIDATDLTDGKRFL